MHLRPLYSGVLAMALSAGTVVGAPAIASAAEPATAGDIVINEVESNGDPVGDWVELGNLDTENELDISGWTLVDDDPDHDPLVIPEGTTIESGGYRTFYTDVDPDYFGLGGNDSVTLRNANGEVIDETTWSGHSPTTWGRVPDMTGDFAVTGESTRGGANIAEDDVEPVETSPWPNDPLSVNQVELGGDFSDEDMSGVDFAPNGTAYVVNNGTGTLYSLDHVQSNGEYVVAGTLPLAYPDGTGTPDAEGVTVGPDGAIYVATERNNDESSTSRPSILRYELPATGNGSLTATDEYDLSGLTGQIGANSGLEAVEYIPDAAGGVFAVGVEATGNVHFVQFGDGGKVTEVQRFESELGGVMALDYEESAGILRVVCDEVCEGRSLEMTYDGDEFVTDGVLVARSAELADNAFEGYASLTETVGCTDGTTAVRTRFLWADDAATDGHGLRGATTDTACTVGGHDGSLEGGSLESDEMLFPAAGSLAPLLAF